MCRNCCYAASTSFVGGGVEDKQNNKTLQHSYNQCYQIKIHKKFSNWTLIELSLFDCFPRSLVSIYQMNSPPPPCLNCNSWFYDVQCSFCETKETLNLSDSFLWQKYSVNTSILASVNLLSAFPLLLISPSTHLFRNRDKYQFIQRCHGKRRFSILTWYFHWFIKITIIKIKAGSTRLREKSTSDGITVKVSLSKWPF